MSDIETSIANAYQGALTALQDFLSSTDALPKTKEAISLISQALSIGGKIIVCGNGGSACDAMHFCEELTGRFRDDRKPLPAIALTDSAHLTAVGNDYGFSEVFSRGVQAHGKKDDVLIGLSTSGNSENVVRAVAAAKEIGMKVILLLGRSGGKLRNAGDLNFVIGGSTSDRIQEVHMTILHVMIEGMERIIFPSNYEG
ncbi:MAG: SIS domain-containing protein [Verrucomicrobia bacterium]|nr:SIS domain-containing protein [Verrucomicrobiota bacterium]